MAKINFGIIGCGRIGNRHAEYISQIANLEAVCDIDYDSARALGTKYGVPYYEDIDEMLSEENNKIDVVSVCTPNGLHAEHSIKAFKAGKHVLCEKPMALTVKDCEKMIKEAEDANKRLFVVKQNRFNPPVEELKRIIYNNLLGEIYSIQLNCFWNRNMDYYKNSTWKGNKLLDGGTLFTQFSHFIDLLYWLFGDIVDINAYMGNFAHKDIIEFEDTGVVALKFDNGALGTINYTVNSYNKNMEGSLTVFGEKGTIKIGGQYLNVVEYQNIEGYEIKDLKESKPANNYGFYQGSMSNHDKTIKNVVDVLNNKGANAVTGLEGLKTVQIINEIYNSAILNGVKS
ncbi:Gfo/Idh/MocA family protein [Flexistipes sp.]|uniref:Gfo/Idh/MocA family protein n=1 Tax=Flexistipes sp. TaxID=3088135 RepID=UPI002E21CE99|nr:Gfo/Idh/MocA family oxidoreductase [Flexistipes sp.]